MSACGSIRAMKEVGNYYSYRLLEELTLKQRANTGYSLRAFARDLRMHPATLHMVLKNKRPLPQKDVDNIVKKLGLSPIEETLFRDSLIRKKTSLDKVEIKNEFLERLVLDESFFKVIAEWEHYAVLSLIEVKDARSDLSFFAERLNLPEDRVEIVLINLIEAKLIKKNESGLYEICQGSVKTTEDISSRALKKSHKETLEIGINKLDEVAVAHRDYSSMTIAVNPEKLPEAKAIIREFRQKLASLLRDGDKTEVFQIAIQLYPLTKMKSLERKL